MKTIPILLLGTFLSALAVAQTVTLHFEGTNKNRNYQVDLNGNSYYSNSSTDQSGATEQKMITLTDLDPGSHSLAVYRTTNAAGQVNTSKGTPVYSTTFQLRQGYDMVIGIKRNGQVTFTEKRNRSTATKTSTPAKKPMTDVEFDKLLQSTRNKWSQSSRITAEKAAFNNKAYNFTTDQVGQLLMLITAENSRLELAKLSYAKVTDPTNFTDVYELLNTQAAKTNLENYVRSKTSVTTTDTKNNDPLNTRPAMANAKFNQLVQTVKNQYQQPGKVAVISDALNVSTNYFSTSQLRQLLTLITAENDRLTLAKQSYARVSDSANFTSLYTLFTTQTGRDEFNNFIRYGDNTTISSTQNTGRIAMSDGEFTKLELKARFHIRESSTIADVRAAFTNTNNYYSISQIRSLLSLVATEADRLALAKLAYHRATEPASFNQLNDLFNSQASVDELNRYITTNRS